ncbi:MAG: DUF4493 domain-containing protein, partial [Alistipes sp.]|nr:DUF4493 domain-containing protein [Alistipes sp.]
MRKYLKLLLLAVVATIATACSLDDLSTTTDNPAEPNTGETKTVGYLKLGGVVYNVDSEDSIVGSDTIESSTRGDESASPSTSDAGDDYYIEIYGGPRHTSTSPFMAWKGTYAEAKAATGGIALEPGTYTVYAYQTEAKKPADDVSATPYYAGKTESVEITSKQTTAAEVVCRMANIKTTVELSADLKEVFKTYDEGDADYAKRLMTNVTLSSGDITPIYHTFERETTHDQPIYFRDLSEANDAGNTMTIALTGMYYTGDRVDVISGSPVDTKWKEVKMVKTITGVKAAQWRKISIGIDYNTSGNAEITVTVQSYTYDQEITVDVATLYSTLTAITQEEEIPDDDVNDPLAPQVKLDGQNTMTFNINSSIYDADAGAWTKYLKANVEPQGESSIEELYVVYRASTNSDLLNKMKDKGFVDGRINLFPTKTTGADTYMNVAADGKTVAMRPAGMDALNKYEGTHTFRLYTKSDDGHLGFGDITIVVNPNGAGGSGNGPTVVWLANGVEADKLTVTGKEEVETATVTVTIASDSGIDGLEVSIVSDKLDAKQLASVGLANEMNIFEPQNAKMETNLRSLGFLPIFGYNPEDDDADKSLRTSMAAQDDENRVWFVNPDDEGNDVKTGNTSPLKGKKEITFTISEFIPLLALLGESESTFTIT